MSDKEINEATGGQLLGAWVGVIVMILLIIYSDMGIMGILGTTLGVSVFVGALIDAPTADWAKAQKVSRQFAKIDKSKNRQGLKPASLADPEDFDLPGYGKVVWESAKGLPVNFIYETGKGQTERTVILHKIYKDSKTRFYFQGYCLLRKALRTFNSEHVADLYDTNGEVFEIPEFIDRTVGYAAYGTKTVREIKSKKNKKH